ncbi:MAG: hypothetical protein JSS07_02645 [Proteobacteria bacterium]|nr:hypothetical protein [Pseudomonadota bacterium]
MLNFAWLAEITTGRRPGFASIIPPLKTIFALLALAMVMAGGMWLWTGFWTGIYANLATFIPMIGKGLAATLGLTVLNFWFSRDINAAMMSTRDIRDDVLYGPTNPVDVTKMVNQLCHEVNAHFKAQFGDAHRDLPVPVLLTYTDDANFKIVTLEGRNPGKAALIFSSGAFDMRRMNQRQLAALIQKELVKIYLRRGIGRTFVGMLSDLATSLENLNAPGNAWYFRALGWLTGPFQLVLLWERSISRTYEYEASAEVVKMWRGPDLIDAMDRKVCPSQLVFPMKSTLKRNQSLHKRDPYPAIGGPIKSFTDWVDQHEYARADKTGWRIVSYFDCGINYTIYFINEVLNRVPRSTNEKQFVLSLTEVILSDGRKIAMDSDEATEALKPLFYQQHREKSRTLYTAAEKSIALEKEVTIAKAKRRKLEDLIPSIEQRLQPYDVIGPDGSGWASTSLDPNLQEAIRHYMWQQPQPQHNQNINQAQAILYQFKQQTVANDAQKSNEQDQDLESQVKQTQGNRSVSI